MEDPDTLAETKKGGGCGKALGCGCLVVVVLLAVSCFVVYHQTVKLVEIVRTEYTADVPSQLPTVEASEQAVTSLKARVSAFAKAVKAGDSGQELALDSKDLNTLIQKHPDWEALNGKVHIELEGNSIKGDASVPLNQLATASRLFKSLDGRWLNGSATFRVELAAGRLLVFLDALSIRGKPVPENFMSAIRAKNLAEGALKKPQTAAMIEKLDTITVRDGKLFIKSK